MWTLDRLSVMIFGDKQSKILYCESTSRHFNKEPSYKGLIQALWKLLGGLLSALVTRPGHIFCLPPAWMNKAISALFITNLCCAEWARGQGWFSPRYNGAEMASWILIIVTREQQQVASTCTTIEIHTYSELQPGPARTQPPISLSRFISHQIKSRNQAAVYETFYNQSTCEYAP